MPMFEYACHVCGREFETLVRTGTVPECPACHSTELEKKLSVFATAAPAAEAALAMPGACGSCGNPAGPGACGWN